MTQSTSELHVPDAFRQWAQTLPDNARKRLSIHELRLIWEPLYEQDEEIERLRETVKELRTIIDNAPHDDNCGLLLNGCGVCDCWKREALDQ